MTKEERTALADNIEIMSEMGFIGGDNEEVKRVREMWHGFNDVGKAYMRGIIDGARAGATAASFMNMKEVNR